MRAFAAALVVGVCACSSTSAPSARTEGTPVLVPFACPDLPSDGAHQVVAIIGEGFDLSLPVFRGKIAGCYSLTCDAATEENPHPTFAEAKAQDLAAYAAKDTRCHLVSGLTLRKSSTLDGVDRAAWNASIVSHTQSAVQGVSYAVSGERTYDYSGTWTASLVAYKNPDVRIVFVQLPNAPARGGLACQTQSDLEINLALIKDPDVRAAYIAAPSSTEEEELVAMYRHHGVTLHNEEYGPISLPAKKKNCPEVADAYAASALAYADLSGARELAHTEKAYAGVSFINVRGSRSDSAVLASMVDLPECPSDPRNVPFGSHSADALIGSWSKTSSTQTFVTSSSNRGPCVSAFAPGEHVVVASPGGFLNELNGTSAAAALVLRHLSFSPPGTTPAAMRDALAAAGPLLPVDWFPKELIYDLATPGTPIEF